MRKASTTRQTLLRAASQLVRDEGVDALTLEAVARVAGVSKGGLLYHFPTKEALISGMIDVMLDVFEENLHRHLDQMQDTSPGAWLRAYIAATFDSSSNDYSIGAALSAAVTLTPQLLTPIRTRFVHWQQQAIASGIDPARATLIRMAVDGVFFADLFGLAPPQDALRNQLAAALDQLTRSCDQ